MDCGIHNFFLDTDCKENTTVNIQKEESVLMIFRYHLSFKLPIITAVVIFLVKKQDQVLYY